MQRRPQFVFLAPRFPWWGWILLLPLIFVAVFLGAVFLFVFIAVGVAAALVLWIRWKWSVRGMSGRMGQGKVHREYHGLRGYDYELKRLDDPSDEQR
ncbi:MAG TPA: hypothetical protein ENN39_06585 [Desulfonatronum sp.]|nr:hypothetical protein [Desulfonatronum sp.]